MGIPAERSGKLPAAAFMTEEIQIRKPSQASEYTDCVRLQNAVWGFDVDETLDESELRRVVDEGGILLCAFLGAGRLVGLVLSFAVSLSDRRIQHSHLLAVDSDFRDRGVGRALKSAQYRSALEEGSERIIWTFDPLEARNAHVNFNILGAFSRTYFEDFYPDSTSPLHAGTATDRFLAEWVVARMPHPVDSGLRSPSLPLALEAHLRSDGLPVPGRSCAAFCDVKVLVEVPPDFQFLKSRDIGLAREWREVTRSLFEAAFKAGYAATAVRREETRDRRRVYFLLDSGCPNRSLASRLDFSVIPFRERTAEFR